jgi:hypothetical protein
MASGAFHAETKPFRQTYRCATFASLATQVQHADGPVVEEELTRQLRLREIGWTKVDLYMQTHPAQDRTVAVRLHSFAPKGLQRLWLDISIDHPDASPTEFGVLLAKSIVEPPFDRYYKDNGLVAVPDDVIHRLPDGSLVKKKLLRPMERGWLDLDMIEPLAPRRTSICSSMFAAEPRLRLVPLASAGDDDPGRIAGIANPMSRPSLVFAAAERDGSDSEGLRRFLSPSIASDRSDGAHIILKWADESQNAGQESGSRRERAQGVVARDGACHQSHRCRLPAAVRT